MTFVNSTDKAMLYSALFKIFKDRRSRFCSSSIPLIIQNKNKEIEITFYLDGFDFVAHHVLQFFSHFFHHCEAVQFFNFRISLVFLNKKKKGEMSINFCNSICWSKLGNMIEHVASEKPRAFRTIVVKYKQLRQLYSLYL